MTQRPPIAGDRTFSVEEVGEVIRTATALAQRTESAPPVPVREGLRFPELLEVARELGIPDDLLRQAIPEAEQQRRRAMKRTRRKMRFWRHLTAYGITMGGLVGIDIASGPDWFVGIPAAFWGIFVGLHAARTFLTGKEGPLHRSVYKKELEAERES